MSGRPREEWDYDEALAEDEAFERRLPVKELLVVLVVLAAVAIRLLWG
jgi:hypothetical protein